MNGLDRFLADPPPALKNARTGLLAHGASRTCHGTHAALALSKQSHIRLQRLFSPEHGFQGLAAPGELVPASRHPLLNLPIHSLYGDTRVPDPAWLQDLDVMLIDLQDLGVRCYTYASTLQNVLHACAAARLPVCVLDRPTPLAGISDGPQLDPSCKSFVGQIDLPLVFGLSQGPLAKYLQQTEPELAPLDLTVFHAAPEAAALPWHPPSPAIVSRNAALLYPVTVWCEAIPDVSVDRGLRRSFHVWGMPDLDAADLVQHLKLPGVQVNATTTEQENWPAIAFKHVDPTQFRPATAAFLLLQALAHQLSPNRLFHVPGARPDFFDKLVGNPKWRKALDPSAFDNFQKEDCQ